MSGLLAACHILYIDHLAVSTSDFDLALKDYMSLDGTRLLKGPAINDSQKVRYAFLQLRDGFVVELLAPDGPSPLDSHIRQGGGPYHFCYAVADIEKSLIAAREQGAKVIVPPTADPAFDGRRIAFLSHRAHGLFEFVEAFPGADGDPVEKEPEPESISSPADISADHEGGELASRLKSVFTKIIPLIQESDLPDAGIDSSPGWDSLAHIQLIMEIEAQFNVEIPSTRIATLTTYADIFHFLDRDVS